MPPHGLDAWGASLRYVRQEVGRKWSPEIARGPSRASQHGVQPFCPIVALQSINAPQCSTKALGSDLPTRECLRVHRRA